LICNQQVVGSSPSASSYKWIVRRVMESDRSIERQRAARISGLRKCSDHRDSWHAAHQFWLIVDRNIDCSLG
ncbi:MAG TPA: hypothetical protein VKA97_00380, partial [Pyrinomonadaceae bacterium]|nr:hypothetical protein [Pyrinomonadaceae bacterium]